MENLMESNDRTLVIFDSVCLGLAECLALVRADIKQMSEHRNKLAAKLKVFADDEDDANETITEMSIGSKDKNNCEPFERNVSSEGHQIGSELRSSRDNDTTTATKSTTTAGESDDDDDPHHLARLKLLDKRLADSFSQALSMCDQQNSSIAAKCQRQHQANNARGSRIFHLLLGKTNSIKPQTRANEVAAKRQQPSESDDKRAMIDDINRQTRLALQYSKELEAHLFKIEDLRSRYELHLKMGLVVKGVSRAYLSSSSSPCSSPTLAGTLSTGSNSLKRRSRHQQQQRVEPPFNRPHHTSSLVVNDSSSSLGTQSSLSSLNLLSTWSFSRRNKQQAAQQQQANDQIMENKSYVSTISLDRQSRRSKQRLGSGLADKLILPMGVQKQREPSPDYYDYDDQYADYLQPQQLRIGRTSTPSDQCHEREMFDCTYEHDYYHDTPNSSRPLSQYSYGDYGFGPVPTTTGTLAGLKLQPLDAKAQARATKLSLAQQKQQQPLSTVINGGGSSLHKSASHSSLKRTYKMPYGACQTIVANNKTTMKDFIENINRLEAEFESYVGSFMLNIEDIQGFARVCPGDVFEVNIRYGALQKFKTKISVLKDNKQKCDSRQIVFKAKIAEVIAIKAYECKGLGKKVLLGNKLCETRDLFTARSQLMTISLNQTGSIKLNLIITWNPLHLVPATTLKHDSFSQDNSFHLPQEASNRVKLTTRAR